MKHNQVIPNQHFHKDWDRRVRTWFNQPAQKKVRRQRRALKAARTAPRPADGPLRPAVRCPTQKYNTKVRAGRGFSLEELKQAGITRQMARAIGIAVDHRRLNKSAESLQRNVQRLQDYRARVVIIGEGETKAADAVQLEGAVMPVEQPVHEVEFVPVTDDMKAFRAGSTVRHAHAEGKIAGIREKMAKEKAAKKKK